MRNLVLLVFAALPLGASRPAPALAEDFTGFYAGVHAGYAFGRDADRSGTIALPSAGPAPADERDLPPSAASASRAMREGRAGRPTR